jgi:hypothetical protein
MTEPGYTAELARQVASCQRRRAKLARIFGADVGERLTEAGIEIRPTLPRQRRARVQMDLPLQGARR